MDADPPLLLLSAHAHTHIHSQKLNQRSVLEFRILHLRLLQFNNSEILCRSKHTIRTQLLKQFFLILPPPSSSPRGQSNKLSRSLITNHSLVTVILSLPPLIRELCTTAIPTVLGQIAVALLGS